MYILVYFSLKINYLDLITAIFLSLFEREWEYKNKYESITKQSNADVEFLINKPSINNKFHSSDRKANIAYNLSYWVINHNLEGISFISTTLTVLSYYLLLNVANMLLSGSMSRPWFCRLLPSQFDF